MTKLHSKEISFGWLSQDIHSIQQLSKESWTLLKRKELWEWVTAKIAEVLQESQDRQESRISKKREKLEEDLSVYDELIDECGEDEEHQLLQDIDVKLTQLDDLNSSVTIDPQKLEERILDILEKQIQQEVVETIKLPRLLLSDIHEIANLSSTEKSSDYVIKWWIKLWTILSICDMKEDNLSLEWLSWISKCRQIAKKLSSEDVFQKFLADTLYSSHDPISDPSHNTFAHWSKKIA